MAKHDHTEVAVIGFIIDPFDPERSNDDIVNDLAKRCTSEADFLQSVHDLAGRYVLLYKDATAFVVVGDACCLRQVYYGFLDDGLVLTSSPKLFLTYFGFDLQAEPEKLALIEDSRFIRNQSTWYGTLCIDNRLNKLLPNHMLDVVMRSVDRIPVTLSSLSKSEDEVLEYSCQLLRGTYTALTNRYRLIQPLTAGWDSRTLLAASKEVKDRIKFYVFDTSNGQAADARVPRQLSRRLGFDFEVINPGALKESFLDAYRREHLFPRILPKTANVQYHFEAQHLEHTLNVNGNALFVRGYYGHAPRRATLNTALVFSGHGRNIPLFRRELEEWYPKAREYAESSGIGLLDLMYWEQRMPHWGAQFPFEQDIALEEISPYNNRSFLWAHLGLNQSRRHGPRYRVYRRLLQRLWPETLAEPFNPDKETLAKIVMGNRVLNYLNRRFRS